MPNYIPPSVSRISFNCPHCGAHAHQKWYAVYTDTIADGELPFVQRNEGIDGIVSSIDDEKTARHVRSVLEQQARGEILHGKTDDIVRWKVTNLNISECYSCSRLAVWHHDRLIIPGELRGPEPNEDLPPEVMDEFREASAIVDLSPRGAAALLRLAIQRLCISLELPGDNLNDDIGSLVERGLDPRIRKALDIVRVVGNNAVHPGKIDLRDDKDTATELFSLVNLIAETMITQPKHVDAMYEKLPDTARKQIEERDNKKTSPER